MVPGDSTVDCLDEMGPEAAKSSAGQDLVRPTLECGPAERAKQEIDYGRRGKGNIFGAFRPANGEAFTHPYAQRSTAHWVGSLRVEQVDHWLPIDVKCSCAIVDNLHAHRATGVLLFALAHPRWASMFQPKYAAYLNLIEPWLKTLRSLALKGRRFETWDAICQAVAAAAAYWNAHRHPFIWGWRRRRQPRRRARIALVPAVA